MVTTPTNGFDPRKFAKEKFDYLFPTEPVILKTVEIEKKKIVLVLLPTNASIFEFLSKLSNEEKEATMFVFLRTSLDKIEKSILVIRTMKTNTCPEIQFIIRFDEKQGVPKVQKIFANLKKGLKLELIYYLYAFGNTTGLKFTEEYPKEGLQYRRDIEWRDNLDRYQSSKILLTDLLFDYYGCYTRDEIMEFSQLFCDVTNEPDSSKSEQVETLARKLTH